MIVPRSRSARRPMPHGRARPARTRRPPAASAGEHRTAPASSRSAKLAGVPSGGESAISRLHAASPRCPRPRRRPRDADVSELHLPARDTSAAAVTVKSRDGLRSCGVTRARQRLAAPGPIHEARRPSRAGERSTSPRLESARGARVRPRRPSAPRSGRRMNHACPSGPTAALSLSGSSTALTLKPPPGRARPIADPLRRSIRTHAPPSRPPTSASARSRARPWPRRPRAGRCGEATQPPARRLD